MAKPIKCQVVRTSYISIELSEPFAKRWYLSSIIDNDVFQNHVPCWMKNTIKEIEEF